MANGENGGMRLRIWIQPQRSGGYVAECPDLPGAVARGATWDETLLEMDLELRTAFAAHLDEAMAAARRQLKEPPNPEPVSLEFAFSADDGEDEGSSYATVA